MERGPTGNEAERMRPGDAVLARKIFIALAQRKFTSIPFPSLLNLSEARVYAIHGAANSGKSLLVQDAAISALFRGRGVVFVDADYRFDVLGFLGKVKDVCRSQKLSTAHFKSACRHMLVQKCGTSTELQLFVSFKLREVLRTSGVDVVVVDSLTSFYWHDRYTRSSCKAFYDSIWLNLDKLRQEFGFTLLVTMQDVYSEQKSPHNFLHCPEVSATTIRVENLGQSRFQLLRGSSERFQCMLKDGTLKRQSVEQSAQ